MSGIMLGAKGRWRAMLWFYGHLELLALGLFATGISLHFIRRRTNRRRYLELREEYALAIQDVRASGGAPPAVLREAELRRAFESSTPPNWFEGFGHAVGRWLKLSAIATLVALFLRGPILRGEENYARRIARAQTAATSARALSPGALR